MEQSKILEVKIVKARKRRNQCWSAVGSDRKIAGGGSGTWRGTAHVSPGQVRWMCGAAKEEGRRMVGAVAVYACGVVAQPTEWL